MTDPLSKTNTALYQTARKL